MFQTISIRSLHLEYQLWIRELTFYKEEIKIFEDHLEFLIQRNTQKEVRARIEHFQNQFIRHKEVIDHLKHDLNISEKQLANYAHTLTENGLESARLDNHQKLREEMLTFKKIYKELKEQFRRFELEWV